MAPLRRYLRITKHSVLEVRIYLDRPSDAETWLLRRKDPVLPRVIEAVRPLVLPKLREENERAKGRSGAKARKKGVKDVVAEDDFEVSIFLTDLSSRHSVLTKQKIVKDDKPRIQSNSGKLTGWLTSGTNEKPMVIAEDTDHPIILREEDDDGVINLDDIPEAGEDSAPHKRRRSAVSNEVVSSGGDSDDSFQFESVPVTKRVRRTERSRGDNTAEDDAADAQDDKKKLGLSTSFDGFSIYGRILCLIVKRKGPRPTTGASGTSVSSQHMLENWVSTQAAADQVDDDEDNG